MTATFIKRLDKILTPPSHYHPSPGSTMRDREDLAKALKTALSALKDECMCSEVYGTCCTCIVISQIAKDLDGESV